MQTQVGVPRARKKTPSKLIAGLAAFLATGIITASGMAGASPNNGNGNGGNRPHNNHHNGQTANTNQGGTINHGYGSGNTSIINNINLNINGNSGVIHVIIHIFNR